MVAMTGEVIDRWGAGIDTDGTEHPTLSSALIGRESEFPMSTTTAPTVTGVSHIDLTVSDLDRSEAWYAELFGMRRVLDGRNDDHHFDSRYLLHAESLLILGLVAHDTATSVDFDEHRVGLDHLSFNVASSEELTDWERRLDERGIDHSPIESGDLWDVLVFRDPDNIQLELFHMKPAAASLLVDPADPTT